MPVTGLIKNSFSERKNKFMQPTVIIREAVAEDISIIRSIAEATWPSAYSHIISKEQLDFMLDWMYSDASLQEQMNTGDQFFLAEYDQQIIGFASVKKGKEGISKLNKLYVLPNIQKTGAGKALLNKAISYAKENASTRLQLHVNRNNTAKDFYEKNGFTVIQEADFPIGNGYFMNDYIMELIID